MAAAMRTRLHAPTRGAPSHAAPSPSAARGSGDASSAQFSDLEPRDRIGSMSLYSAHEASTGRAVVLKVVDEAAPQFAHDALAREANYLAMLGGHPHIATLYQSTTLAENREALVLESCPSSVVDAVRDARLTPATSVSIAIKIAGALETLHRAGLVHCAVRPQNILLTEFDEPVLADFSVTIRRDEDAFLGLHETTAHTAPELLLGEPATPATDVYALTSTVYEMVAGKAAYATFERESPAAISLRILAGGVRPIVSPDIPLELSDLLVWGMNPDASERPPSAAWLAEELGRIEQKNGWLRTRMVTGEPKFAGRRRRRFFR